jgi:predicted dehydrogenase
MHSYWARAALKSGHHVIVDKPALTEFDDAQIIVELAASKNLCVAEANVWYHHPIVRTLKFFIGQQKAPPLAIYSTFTSPAMNSRNFRYRTDMGGGAILDRASYAISCGRVLLGGMPVNVHCQKSPYLETREVETSFSLLANYDNGAVMLAFMSIEAEYRNCVEIIGCDYTLEVDRLFTPPDNYEADIIMRQNNVTKKIQVSESNSFREFIGEVVKSVESGNFSYYSEVLLEDARVMNSIKISAKGE